MSRIFSRWHTLNWWEQRRQIQAIKDHPSYIERALVLLAQSRLAPYIDYADDLVAKSSDPEVKRAWMRKRLVLQECFWNALDTISHAVMIIGTPLLAIDGAPLSDPARLFRGNR